LPKLLGLSSKLIESQRADNNKEKRVDFVIKKSGWLTKNGQGLPPWQRQADRAIGGGEGAAQALPWARARWEEKREPPEEAAL
jgi:hypothetical protein